MNRAASRVRALIGWLAATSGNATLSEVARRLKRDMSAISRAVTQLERMVKGMVKGGKRVKGARLEYS